jgi:hypothetical protein
MIVDGVSVVTFVTVTGTDSVNVRLLIFFQIFVTVVGSERVETMVVPEVVVVDKVSVVGETIVSVLLLTLVTTCLFFKVVVDTMVSELVAVEVSVEIL